MIASNKAIKFLEALSFREDPKADSPVKLACFHKKKGAVECLRSPMATLSPMLPFLCNNLEMRHNQNSQELPDAPYK
jgi:hypothetical protein